MLLHTCRVAPAGPGWVLEPKWDGYRLMATTGPRAEAWTRHGTRLEERLPELRAALDQLPAGTLLDGELVALGTDADGRPAQAWEALGELWRRGRVAAGVDVRLVCFDVLEAGGRTLDDRPWYQRRARLCSLLEGAPADLVVSPVFEEDLAGAHARLVATGFEGSVLKQGDGRYARARRSRGWLKLKQRQTATVRVAFGSRGRDGAFHAAFREPDVDWLQWATVRHLALQRTLGAGARDLEGQIAFSHRNARGAAREARLVALAAAA